jgi:hypothetical protein
MNTPKAKHKRADFMAQSALFFEKLDKHRGPRRVKPKKYTFYGAKNR